MKKTVSLFDVYMIMKNMVLFFKKNDELKVNTLVMDNDSTTIARVKATVDPNIRKKCDSNHTRKGFTGKLVDMSNTFKALKNVKVRGHVERCFMYCVKQNQGKSTQLEEDLQKIVPHLYGMYIYA